MSCVPTSAKCRHRTMYSKYRSMGASRRVCRSRRWKDKAAFRFRRRCSAVENIMRWKYRETRWSRQAYWMAIRSEEHTSELQSLMRISYAVFGLKKKKETTCEDKIKLQL